ncbi:MAG: hypothetical protein KF785_16855 [Gemmatimonadales bacterium]|nr:hypothetical protein [Gemmatimonadales bacterium]
MQRSLFPRWRIGGSIIASLVPALLVGQQLPPVERFMLLDSATAASRRNDHAVAARLYQRLAADHPTDGEMWYKYAFASFYASGRRDFTSGAAQAIEHGTFFFRERFAHELAKAAAVQGDRAGAFDWIRRALGWRYTPRTNLATDTIFRAYRSDPEFRELAGMLPDRPFTREEGYRYDVRFLVGEARRLHASFNRQAFSPRFDSLVSAIEARIPSLNERQFAVELQRLVVALEDGHTKVALPPAARQLPLVLYLFDDGVYVVGGTDAGTELIGSQIIRFGLRSAEEVIADLPAMVNRDNDQGLKWVGAWTLTILDYLHALGASDSEDSVSLTIRDRAGRTRKVRLAGGPLHSHAPAKLGPPPGENTATPLYLRNVRTPYWFTSLPEAAAVYFQFNQVAELPEEPMARFAPRLRAAIADPAVRHLIVDVRHNTGGNSFLFPPLLRLIGAFHDADPDRRVFYLTSRHTFSAAQNFSTNVDRLTDAIFVGEPTGSSPNFVGEGPNFFTLPFSGIRVTISNWYHQFSFWPDSRQALVPELPIPVRSVDYFAGRDAALDAVLAIAAARGR